MRDWRRWRWWMLGLSGGLAGLGLPAQEAEAIRVAPGFRVERLHTAAADEGAWQAMTVDDRGRLLILPGTRPVPDRGGLLRLTPGTNAPGVQVETLTTPVAGAGDLLHAAGALYVCGEGPQGRGLYRLPDTGGDNPFDAAELLKALPAGGAGAGRPSIVRGPEGLFYLAVGNVTALPDGLATNAAYANFADDCLLPRLTDPGVPDSGRGRVPHGYVVRTDSAGQRWELVAGGLLRPCGLAFDPDGELFTWDGNLESEAGLPWHRSTRLLHATSGAEFGFREGSAKWPAHYFDSLPAVADTDAGGPAGIQFGTRAAFPARWKRALFLPDAAGERILAAHLRPAGASFSAEVEEFVSGRPLPVTDLEFGTDGAMYFITGGTNAPSRLYRVTWPGPLPGEPKLTAAEQTAVELAAEARWTRRQLEELHARADLGKLDFVWTHLASRDRHLRFAARVALEKFDPGLWRGRAFAERRPDAAFAALAALIRVNGAAQGEVLEKLFRFLPEALSEPQTLDWLRTISLSFSRQGRPEAQLAFQFTERFNAFFPFDSEPVDRELAALLAWLDAPALPAKLVPLLTKAPSPTQQIHYALCLRIATRGWTPELRRDYFAWFDRALRDYQGGSAFRPFLERIREEAAKALPAPGTDVKVTTGAPVTEPKVPEKP